MHSVRHHPRAETLAAYSAGVLDEARAVVIATHLAMCSECRESVGDFNALGGVCLEACAGVPMSASAFDVLERASRPDDGDPAHDRARTLGDWMDTDLDATPWRPVLPGVAQHVLSPRGSSAGVLRLLRIAPGTRLSRHTHRGEELTLILRGAYRDETGSYGPGDLADLDDTTLHAPVATGDEPCVCLIAATAPLAFRDLPGRLVQPLVGL